MNLPAIRPLLPARAPRLPVVVSDGRGRVLPVVRGAVALVAAGLAAEFAVRAVMKRVAGLITAATRPAAPAVLAAGRMSRTVVTEIVVRERFRRPR